jgi:hypothetical protein
MKRVAPGSATNVGGREIRSEPPGSDRSIG